MLQLHRHMLCTRAASHAPRRVRTLRSCAPRRTPSSNTPAHEMCTRCHGLHLCFFFPRESSWSQGDGHASHDVDALCSVAWCLQQAGSHLHVQMCVEPLAQQCNLFLARPFPSVNCRLSECLWWTQTPNQQGCWRCTNTPDTKTLGCKLCVA